MGSGGVPGESPTVSGGMDGPGGATRGMSWAQPTFLEESVDPVTRRLHNGLEGIRDSHMEVQFGARGSPTVWEVSGKGHLKTANK